MKSSVMSTPL